MNLNLNGFEAITLEQMSGIRLMKRIDKKFVIPLASLQEVLNHLTEDYFVQTTSGQNAFCYSTLYYDTPDYAMYTQHQNGKLNRLKIRTREYVDSSQCFLEVKKKSNKGITKKVRISHDNQSDIEEDRPLDFLISNSPYSSSMIEAKLSSNYHRITLVNKAKTERVTIDFKLHFVNHCTKRQVHLPNLAIIEIKKEQSSYSPIEVWLNKFRIKPTGMSKYCIGVALTDESVKQNAIKSKLILLNKITDINYG